MKKLFLCVLVGLATGIVASALPAARVLAATIDLTAPESSGTINGAIFMSPSYEVSGTGLIDSFVRIQATGIEQGYNVDVAKQSDFEYHEMWGTYTHSLQLSDIQDNIVNILGITYYEFMLDINEIADGANYSLLSMHELELYLDDAPNVVGHNGGGGAELFDTLIYDLDAGEDSVVELDYDNFPGSGRLDMFALFPTELFGDDHTQYIYLYSAFGDPSTADNGFEEWAHKLDGTFTPAVPIPSAVWLLGSGLVGLVGLKKKFKK